MLSGFDKTLSPGQLTLHKINGKLKIKKAQNYRRFHGRRHHLGSGANTATFTVNVWEKS